jgi:hypothetical protein
MPIRPVHIDQATPEQQRDYVRNFLQIEVAPTESPEAIRAKINAAQPGVTQIFVNEPDTPEQHAAGETTEDVELKREEATGKQSGSLGRGDPRAVIHIPIVETEDGSGARDVLVGVNGRAWQLKRGHDLPVPWRVIEALQNAEATIIRHSQEEGHEGEVISHNSRRVAFSFIERPSQAEIDAWLERTGAEFCA